MCSLELDLEFVMLQVMAMAVVVLHPAEFTLLVVKVPSQLCLALPSLRFSFLTLDSSSRDASKFFRRATKLGSTGRKLIGLSSSFFLETHRRSWLKSFKKDCDEMMLNLYGCETLFKI